ncbi:sprouty-related, EVH1 domain-containing protein 2 [Syngnathoides biaculeatus]|uniref:sprouty-related, EVH1 domain-containing protein 2 n=1 Tax=Syngnathoides biaculeatus TaxID=300417 RepID=UPI002ADE7C8C|nr:sprouty-related, EVH1 domain-containing protein 2 [Syngnathoides biaculeatus]XP_061685396.1 sprouty-related, EVH1 domain-containing protein 2 [Syngnathoides biaculeatus]XP_061685397.1 sprouty-related, EVH1 domain-containing protein 2 [Syngnathoides biaculeatus]XP_061685398.1 sprouty-related, EVH1 domain-containing protein 2 [Syngnathoides biaculeatus]
MSDEEHHPTPHDDSYMVRVKALVMTRDDSSGGWLPQDGGLSRVGVCRLTPGGPAGRSSFLIHAERLRDRQVILECSLKKDLVYTKATPTFHHWRVDNRKCGLTFQSPTDARAFDRGVRKALEDLTEGSTTSSSTLHNEAELGDDDVFTTATDSSSNSSQRKEPVSLSFCEHRRHPRCILGHLNERHQPSDQYFYDRYFADRCFLEQAVQVFPRHVSFHLEEEVVQITPRERAWLTRNGDYRHATATRETLSPFSTPDAYVHDAPKLDYGYPYPLGKSASRGDPAPVRVAVTAQPQLKRGHKDGERLRCVYCQDLFQRKDNRRGRCQEAPDPIQTCIRRVSFLWCADSLLYHCMSDPEGDYSDACSCEAGDERFCLRWSALLALSLLVPCMCCYLPLTAMHRCGVACRCCGGRHRAAE